MERNSKINGLRNNVPFFVQLYFLFLYIKFDRGESMKNVINYYYNLLPEEIHQNGSITKFEYQNEQYTLLPYSLNTDIKSLYEMSVRLLQRGIYTHQIIPNKDGQLLTMVNNTPYLVLKHMDDLEKEITLEDLIAFQEATKYITYDSELVSWQTLWSNKIDYFEYQVSQFGRRNPNIRKSFSFYVGLAENGIILAKTIEKQSKKIVHRRIYKKSTFFDLYNPLNFVQDISIRDIAEYFKDAFLYDENVFEEITKYFQTHYLTAKDYQTFFVRMFYPSFYFDRFEKVMDGELEDDELAEINKKSDDYIALLKKLYLLLSGYVILPEIEWLRR